MSSSSDHPLGALDAGLSSIYAQVTARLITFVSTGVLMATFGFTMLGGRFSDLYVNLTGVDEPSGEVSIVTIGPEALALWDARTPRPEVTPRDLIAQLIRVLDEAGARTIALDILLDDSQPGDDALRAAVHAHGTIIGAERYEVGHPQHMSLFTRGVTPALARDLAEPSKPYVQGAFVNIYEEESAIFSDVNVFRGAYLLRRTARLSSVSRWPDELGEGVVTLPALSLAAAWLHRARAQESEVTLSRFQQDLKTTCGDAVELTRCQTLTLRGLPVISNPHEVFALNPLGSDQLNPIPIVDAATLLRLSAAPALMRRYQLGAEDELKIDFPQALREQLRDRLVIIGRVDAFTHDRYTTSYSFPLFNHKDMSGVILQAQLADSLLLGRRLTLSPAWLDCLIMLLCSALHLRSLRRARPRYHLFINILMISALIGLGTLMFKLSGGVALGLGPAITSIILISLAIHLPEVKALSASRGASSDLSSDTSSDTPSDTSSDTSSI